MSAEDPVVSGKAYPITLQRTSASFVGTELLPHLRKCSQDGEQCEWYSKQQHMIDISIRHVYLKATVAAEMTCMVDGQSGE